MVERCDGRIAAEFSWGCDFRLRIWFWVESPIVRMQRLVSFKWIFAPCSCTNPPPIMPGEVGLGGGTRSIEKEFQPDCVLLTIESGEWVFNLFKLSNDLCLLIRRDGKLSRLTLSPGGLSEVLRTRSLRQNVGTSGLSGGDGVELQGAAEGAAGTEREEMPDNESRASFKLTFTAAAGL